MAVDYEFLRNKAVLVTGSTGLIGSCLVHTIMELNAKYDYNTAVFASFRNEKKAQKLFEKYSAHPCFNIVVLDITAPTFVNAVRRFVGFGAPKGLDYIVHSATDAHPKAYAEQPVEVMNANYIGTLALLELAKHYKARMLYLSSSEIYGDSRLSDQFRDGTRRFTETDYAPLDPNNARSSYPESKRAAETLCKSYLAEYGVESIIARPAVVYGATDSKNTRADAEFLRLASRGKDIVLKSDGARVRSYVYVKDCANALLTLLKHGTSGEAYNIADENAEVSMRKFAETCAKVAGVKLLFDYDTSAPQPAYGSLLLDTAKINALGWNAEYGLEMGVGEAIRNFNA
ncbi:MAG: NAD-dependent epimerase/dehydratase family protein [Bifidobacteriaceae bacterium]|jgi:nucleoside-diphosphate-sugar epimerase|nr:NAD-dependent epimerase/dehydratase family protein [Bifidobacteriaceae bacterium]